MTPPRRPRATTLLVAVCAATLVLTVGAAPAGAQEWLKPGTPHTSGYPDPSLTRFGSTIMAYATNNGGMDLPVKWSADYRTWTARVEYEGSAANRDGDQGYFNDAFPSVPWGIDYDRCDAGLPWCDPKELWAPSVGLVGTRYMAYHAVKVAPDGSFSPYGRFCIYASTAPTPMGEFTAASGSPIVCPSSSTDPGGAIDPDVFTDESSGRNYLLWKTEGNAFGNFPAIWVAELNSAGTGLVGTPRKLLQANGAGWEGSIVENPSMVKYQGRWWLIYSGNEYVTTNYAVGYATCSGPLGPCTRGWNNPILTTAAGRFGPGGADGIVDERGRLIAAYHAWTGASGNRGTGSRTMRVAQLTTNGGTMSVVRADAGTGADQDAMWSFRPDLTYHNAPAGNVAVGGDYAPVTGDFDGDGRAEIFWYGAWNRGDANWEGTATPGVLSKRNYASGGQEGTFVPVPGDFNGDGRDDIFWYQPGGDPIVANPCCNHEPYAENDEFWFGRADGGFDQVQRSQAGVFIPLAGDFDGNGTTDILWYAPGNDPDQFWLMGTNGVPTVRATTITGNYRPIVGNFNGDAHDDIFWYGPGAIADSVWTFSGNASFRSAQTRVLGDAYRPFSGNFDGDASDEMFFYGPGAVPDSIWTTVGSDGSFVPRAYTVRGIYSPVTADYDGNGVTDVFWYR